MVHLLCADVSKYSYCKTRLPDDPELPLHRKKLSAHGQWGFLSATYSLPHASGVWWEQTVWQRILTTKRAGGEQETNHISKTVCSYEVQLDINILGHGREGWIPQTLLYFLYIGLWMMPSFCWDSCSVTKLLVLKPSTPEHPDWAAFIIGEESLFLCILLLCCRANTLI